MSRLIDLTGKKFGRLTVISREPNKGSRPYWLCRCECGGEKVVRGEHLRSGATVSCKCFHKEVISETFTTHGMSESRLFSIWSGVKNRCLNENEPAYPYYGGRGIKVCEEWLEFEPFRDWAINNEYEDELTIDRIDNNGDYEPSNCEWVSMKKQSRNRRSNVHITIDNETKTMMEWSELSGVQFQTIRQRYKRGIRGQDLISKGRVQA